jgi:hypothetical protein
MNDTSPRVAAIIRGRYAAMSPSERVRVAAEMFETARTLAALTLPAASNAVEGRKQLCRRLYGDDLARKAYPSD